MCPVVNTKEERYIFLEISVVSSGLYLPLSLELLHMFFVLLPLHLSRLTDGVFAAVGALLRLCGAAEKEMAVITSVNHLSITYDISLRSKGVPCNFIFAFWNISTHSGSAGVICA